MQFESKDPSPSVAHHAEFSLERISRLVSDLEQELALAPAGSPKLHALHDEIALLKQTLSQPNGPAEDIEQQLHGMREKLSDLAASVEGEVLRDTPYLAEIGRILGLI